LFKLPENYTWTHVVNPITEEEVRTWVANLRSGNFKQGNGYLNANESYCCLGVLGKDNLVPADIGHPMYAVEGYMASSQCTLSGNTLTGSHVEFKMPHRLQARYYGLNDSEEKSFAEIADAIEQDFGL